MNKRIQWVLAVWAIMLPLSASAGLLQKTTDAERKQISLPGYSALDEQAFKVASGPLAGKMILFASFDPAVAPAAPKFFVLDNGKVIDSQPLPNLVEGWNIVDVKAVTAIPSQGNITLRVLAVLTLEPISNRPQDYWDQAFVFDVAATGKIDANAAINQKIADKKPAIKTLEALKAFLSK